MSMLYTVIVSVMPGMQCYLIKIAEVIWSAWTGDTE